MHYSRLPVIQLGIRLLMTQNLLMGVFCSFLISLNCFVKNPLSPAGAEGDYFIRKVCRADGNFGQPCRPPPRARARSFIDAVLTALLNLCAT